jgi:pimeloyl-ACP methyl ester carboxylesterase
VGLSFGFLVATRMLQRYPELTKKVDFFVSAVGFSHYEDFVFSKPRLTAYRLTSKLFTVRPLALFFRYTALDPAMLRLAYKRTFNAKKKFAGADADLSKRLMDMEIVLWHCNDVRTHMYTTHEMLTVDNCQKQVDLPVWHVSAGTDQYFNPHMVEQHMRVIFTDFYEARNKSPLHAPSVVADIKESASFIPYKLRRALQKR